MSSARTTPGSATKQQPAPLRPARRRLVEACPVRGLDPAGLVGEARRIEVRRRLAGSLREHADRYDAGVRLVESTEKDMVAVRAAPPFRFAVVGASAYLKERGRPAHPRDLLAHDCIGFRAMSTGTLYAWEFERKGREFKVRVSGPVVTNDAALMVRAAILRMGLAYVPDFSASDGLRSGTLEAVLDDFMPSAPGLFVYFPGRAKEQPKMRALLAAVRAVKGGGLAE